MVRGDDALAGGRFEFNGERRQRWGGAENRGPCDDPPPLNMSSDDDVPESAMYLYSVYFTLVEGTHAVEVPCALSTLDRTYLVLRCP